MAARLPRSMDPLDFDLARLIQPINCRVEDIPHLRCEALADRRTHPIPVEFAPRAEDYWTLRERFEQGEIDIDPDDDKLAAQLGSIKWGIDSRGRIKIESKDDMRKRGLPSPDRADCAAIAFAGKANAAPMNVESHAGESITGDLMTKAW